MMGYYAGDRGFFAVLRSMGSAAAGMIAGVGGGLSRVIGGIGRRGTSTAIQRASGVASGIMRQTTGAIVRHPVLSAAGAAGALAVGAEGVHLMGRGGHRQSARHLHALAMGRRRAKPRMNVTNVHALRRALRRTHGFAKLAMRTIHLVHPKKHARFGGFKKRRQKPACWKSARSAEPRNRGCVKSADAVLTAGRATATARTRRVVMSRTASNFYPTHR